MYALEIDYLKRQEGALCVQFGEIWRLLAETIGSERFPVTGFDIISGEVSGVL
jgi:hypothetical protein